ncbi:T9SS type A sorting domain-containing protein [Winogradskyella litorisediminis]|uniref:T9SS type A sorting domain-containing protein n=1 Tax=Winogradskyella litorisediminis TaxID=1156618 RepID=A0ABW3NBP3_9FLAO
MFKKLLFAFLIFFSIKGNSQLSTLIDGIVNPVGMAQNGNILYFGAVGSQKIQFVDTSQANPILQDLITNIDFPSKFVVIGTDLYFTYAFSTVAKINLTEPTPTVTNVISTGNSFYGIAQKDNYIYVSERNSGEILRFDYTQINPTTEVVATGLGNFTNDISIDGDYLYVSRGSASMISRINLTQTPFLVEDIVSTNSPLEAKVNNGNLYISGSNYLKKVNLSNLSQEPETLLSGVTSIWDISFNGTNIYLAQQTDGRIAQLDETFIDPTTSPDYANLVALYNATDGASWTNNSNWLNATKPLYSWHGLEVENNRVTSLNLFNNNISNSLPSEIGNLSELLNIDLSFNDLTGSLPSELLNLTNVDRLLVRNNNLSGIVPDFETLPNLINLEIDGNNFQFGDLEPNHPSNTTIPNYGYWPQQTISQDNNLTLDYGENPIIQSNASGANNVYQWYFNGELIPGESNADLIVTNFQQINVGHYYCEITNTAVNELVLRTGTTTINSTNAPLPVNDLIENAIEVPIGGFIDQNVRLDLATSTGGGSDCGVDSFQRVYYKFTATANGPVNLNLNDSNFQSVNANSFIIPYTAPNLNITDEAQLTVVPGLCAFGLFQTFTAVAGQNYYVQVCRNLDANQFSDVSIFVPEDVNQADRDALINFYNNNDGPNWNNNTNWNTSNAVGSWFGLEVENGRVVGINLSNNNLTGNTISDLLALDNLALLNLNNNNITGLVPDFSTLSQMDNLDLRSNNFSFADLETNFTVNNSLTTFNFSPQKETDTEESFEAVIGSDYTFTMTPVAGTNISYQWYKTFPGNTSPFDDPVIGATSNVLSITNTQSEDLNVYICAATSPSIPDFRILRAPVELFSDVSQGERDALMAFYNALDGDNWTDNTNWGSTTYVRDWSHVITAGNKVVGIDVFGEIGLNGQLPSEIDGLIHLKNLSLALNVNLSGPIPASIGNITTLERLRLQGTSNSGTLPSSIGNLTNLEELRLIGNNFNGDIPSTFNNLVSLKDFYLIGSVFQFNGLSNLFTGELPSFSNSPELFSIRVSGNDFSGELADYSQLPSLSTLYVDENLYSFSDLSVNQANNETIDFYVFSPQRNNSEPETVNIAPGSSITLDINGMVTTTRYFERLDTDQYQWFKDEVAISGANQSTYTISNPQESDSGVYYCEITNSTVDGLVVKRADITLNVNASLGIDDVEISNFKLYPNPTTDWITISANALQNATATIYDLNGRLVQRNALKSNTNTVNIQNLTAGVYIMKITTSENKTVTKRFVKQ